MLTLFTKKLNNMLALYKVRRLKGGGVKCLSSVLLAHRSDKTEQLLMGGFVQVSTQESCERGPEGTGC